MPISKHILGIKGDECQCGRKSSVRHCPECGSTRVYAFADPQYKEKLVPDSAGNPITTYERVQMFRCQACNHRYTDAEREFCAAPPVGSALARQRAQALAESIQTDSTIPDAVKELVSKPLEAPTKSSREAYQEFRRFENQIINCWLDEVEVYKSKGQQHPQTKEEYVELMLIQHGVARVPEPLRDSGEEDLAKGA